MSKSKKSIKTMFREAKIRVKIIEAMAHPVRLMLI
jgi:hypothetical protein